MPRAKKKKKTLKYRNYVIYGRGNLGSRRWKVDYDYIKNLTEEEKNFLNDFTEEYYLANFKKDKKTGKYKGRFLKNKEDRRKSWFENSVSNRCVMSLNNTKGKASTQVMNYDNDKGFENKSEVIDKLNIDYKKEDNLIELIEQKAKLRRSKRK